LRRNVLGIAEGSRETLRQRSGNDCDQASLLIALLRASGFPSRYVRGTIRFFPDIRTTKNNTGIDDPAKIAELFQKAGIPSNRSLQAGRFRIFEVEHLWVETQVPYANYRGAVLDEHGKAWLGLDTSIKVKDHTYNEPTDIFQELSLSNGRDDYLSKIQNQTPLDYVKTEIETYLSKTS